MRVETIMIGCSWIKLSDHCSFTWWWSSVPPQILSFYRLLGAGHRKASTAEVLEIETSDNFEAVCLQYKHYPPIAGQYEWWYQHLAWGKENKLINCGNFGIQNLQQCWGVSTNQSNKSCTLALKPWSELASHGSRGSRLTRQLAWVRLTSQYLFAWLLTHKLTWS